MSQIEWRGVFPALTTKFTADGSLDYGAMASHLEFQLDAGVHGLVILGSLGESATLDAAEKSELVQFFAQADRRGRPLVVTIAERATRRACAFATACEEAGADGLMVLPPMGYPSDRRETHTHLKRVAGASNLPVMLYNNPLAYGTDLTTDDLIELADNPKFVAVKESSGDTRRISELRRRSEDRYAIFCGIDDLAYESFSLGAVGWVAGMVCAFPRETVKLYELMVDGEWEEARTLYEWFLPLLHLDVGSYFVHQIKLVEALMGVGSAGVRAPRLQLTDRHAAEVEAILSNALENRPDC